MNVLFKEGDDILFYMDYYKFSKKGLVMTESDSELYQEPAILGVVVDASTDVIKIQVPGQPIDIAWDVPERYVRVPRVGSWFTELGGRWGSIYVYLILAGIIVWL